MIGSITPEHTKQDIIDAQNLGLDAFALNLGMSVCIGFFCSLESRTNRN